MAKISTALSMLVLSPWISTAAVPPSLAIAGSDLVIEGDLGHFKPSWQFHDPEPQLMLATLTVISPPAASVPAFQAKWKIPAVDLAGVWTSDIGQSNFDHQGFKVESRAVRNSPLVTLLNPADLNRMTVSLSDTMRPLGLEGGIREEDVSIHMTVKLFAENQPPMKRYQVTFRFDTRPLPFHQVLKDTARWWAAQDVYKPAAIPETARMPIYSTWYSYHQGITPDAIVEKCRLGGQIGLETVIVDDGWQTLDSSRGYAFSGDWKPERIPEMKGFVARIHASNQKFILWYSVPMAVEQSAASKRFAGKTLGFSKALKAHVLAPRYPEVREYLLEIYEHAVNEWGVNGLKLDFIDLFAPNQASALTAEEGREFASVDEAVDRLFTDIMLRSRAIKPEIAIEFRQPYNGTLMRKYENMLRAVDCPNAGPVNRKEVVDLRLLADHTAVHSAMIIWHPMEPVESAALQIINVLFSVPQISVRLAEVSPEHRRMIGFWKSYWKQNRRVLLNADFQPISPAQNDPMVIARNQEKMNPATYQDIVVTPGPQAPPQIDVVNAKPAPSTVLRLDENYGRATIGIFDCRGTRVSEDKQTLGMGVHAWQVPPSGMLVTRREMQDQ